MIVYDKEQKEIVIPNGIGNINLFNNGVEAGYNQGKTDGIEEQKSKLESINITENGTYRKEDGYNEIVVDVPDLNGSYSEGYEQGKTDGINEQKSKLESISITENGTYNKEDGYNHIEVNVADLNGSYDEGYAQGQADVAANARVLNVTKNGNYLSKFSDPIIPTLVTGVYADGTKFYSYAELNGKVFNTKIAATENSRLEFWYKGDNKLSGDGFNVIIGAGNNDNQNCFQVRYFVNDNDRLFINLGGDDLILEGWDDRVWHHLIVSKAEGIWVDGEKKKEYEGTIYYPPEGEFYINGIGYDTGGTRNANGTFGMVKIDDVVFIPTADGFQNVNTGELIEVVQNGGYTFTENAIKYGEGELYKTVNVNVISKTNVQKTGLRFGYSIFTEVPEWADFEGIRDMRYMFASCPNLQTIPLINTSNVIDMSDMFNSCPSLQTIPQLDTSNVRDMNNMFSHCGVLQTIPLINTSNVIDMSDMFNSCPNLQTIPPINTSNVTDMSGMFSYCHNLQAIPQFDTSKVTNMLNIFSSCRKLTSIPALNAQSLNMPSYYSIFGYEELPNITDFGGFLNLKCSLTDDGNLKKLPNLTYESCINILNGLYDFTGNGETPNSEQGQLKVHQNFLDKVGDKISIGTSRGWTISV